MWTRLELELAINRSQTLLRGGLGGLAMAMQAMAARRCAAVMCDV